MKNMLESFDSFSFYSLLACYSQFWHSFPNKVEWWLCWVLFSERIFLHSIVCHFVSIIMAQCVCWSGSNIKHRKWCDNEHKYSHERWWRWRWRRQQGWSMMNSELIFEFYNTIAKPDSRKAGGFFSRPKLWRSVTNDAQYYFFDEEAQ